jgi:hypothetical protein
VFCAGCFDQNKSTQLQFYYPRLEYTYGNVDGMIAGEPRADATDHSAAKLLNLYLEGPVDPQFVNPFPEELEIIDVRSDGHALYITVSDHMAKLSGASLITACACLAKTGMHLVGVESAYVHCESLLLDGKKGIWINEDTTIFYDDTSALDSAD